jgi:hypothetical protein
MTRARRKSPRRSGAARSCKRETDEQRDRGREKSRLMRDKG